MKIRSLLLLTLACFSMLAMIAFNVYINVQIGAAAEKQYSELISEMSLKQAESLDLYFSTLQRKMKLFSANYNLLGFAADADAYEDAENEKYIAAKSAVEAFFNSGVGATNVLLTDGDGKVLLSGDGTKVGSYFTNSLIKDTPEFGICVNTITIIDKSMDFEFISYAMVGDCRLAVTFSSDFVKAVVKQATFPTNGRILLFDANGAILDTNYVGNIADTNMKDYSVVKQYVLGDKELQSGAAVRENYEVNKNKRITYITKIGDTGWEIAATGEADKAFVYSSSAATSVTNCDIILCIVFAALNVIFVFVFTKPLYTIEETLLKIRRGDHEARININSKNEYGEIAKAFNSLVDDIIVSEGRYRTIIEMSDNIIFEWNFKTNEVFFSNNFNKKFSYRAPSDYYDDSFLLKCKVHPDDAERYKKDLESLRTGEELKQNEYRWKNIYGDYIWTLMRTTTIRDNDNKIIKVVGVIVDIDRAKKSEKLLTTRASFDSLTGLYNRETVENLINNEIELVTARKSEFAILFVDVDDFKIYNDKYSHATGDQVLKFTASTIQEVISQFGIAGRYGGDEFVICVRNSETNDPGRVAQDILNKLKEGFVCDLGERLTVQVSIGITIIHDAAKRVDEIIGLADDAMYKIKKSGKFNYGFFK